MGYVARATTFNPDAGDSMKIFSRFVDWAECDSTQKHVVGPNKTSSRANGIRQFLVGSNKTSPRANEYASL